MMPCGGCILVVDDDADIRDALQCCLHDLGCTAVTAVDGLDALERLERGARPCVILLDLNMPRLDGEGFAWQVRRDVRHSTLPIISMSAGAQRLSPPMVQAHLVKPFELDGLASNIHRHCLGH